MGNNHFEDNFQDIRLPTFEGWKGTVSKKGRTLILGKH